MLVHFLSNNEKLSLLLLLPPVLIFVALYALAMHPDFVSVFLENLYSWWSSTERSTFLPPYYPFLLIPILLLFSFVCYLLQRFYYTRVLIALATTAFLIVLTFLNYDPGKMLTVLFLIYSTLILFETSFRYSLRKHPLTDLSYVLHLWPVTILLVVLLMVFPYKETPMEWTLARSVWNNLTETWNRISTSFRFSRSGAPLEFDLNISGYSDEAELGGNLFSGNAPVLEVTTDRSNPLPLYLVGNSKNIYTGTSWENNYVSPAELSEYNEYQLDTIELLYATLRSDLQNDFANLYRRSNYQITFHDYVSRTMFQPQKLYNIMTTPGERLNYTATDTNIVFEDAQGYGTTYRSYCYQLNLGSQQLFDFTLQSDYSYDGSANIAANLKTSLFGLGTTSSLVQNTDDLFRCRLDSIRASYLSLPENLPERVYKLAEELTAGCVSDYEKMLTLESYLNRFSYSRTPERMPQGFDFVDYFLFESQEGYCTYFASALAVLGRCLDIPTRYVQGYCLGAEPESQQYTVYSSDAHAWVEAYLPGFGWIPLDATPGYSELRYQPWYIADRETEAPGITIYRPTAALNPEDITTTPAEEPGQPANIRFLPLFLLIPLMLVVLFSVYMLQKLWQMRKFYRESQTTDRYFSEFARLLDLLARLNLKAGAAETLQQFFERVTVDCPDRAELLDAVCNSFMSTRYGNHPVDLSACEQLSSLLSAMEHILRERHGKTALFSYRLTCLIHFKAPE